MSCSLSEICEINPKKPKLDKDLDVSFIDMATMPVDGYRFVHSTIKKVSEVEKGYTYFAENDILLAKITPCFENGKCGIATNLKNGIGFGSTEFIVLRPKIDILPEYLYIFIANSNFIENGKTFMSGTVGQQRLQIDFVKNFKIPVVDIEKQREITNEIDDIYSLIASNRKIANKQQNKMQKLIQSLWKQDQEKEVEKQLPNSFELLLEKAVQPFPSKK